MPEYGTGAPIVSLPCTLCVIGLQVLGKSGSLRNRSSSFIAPTTDSCAPLANAEAHTAQLHAVQDGYVHHDVAFFAAARLLDGPSSRLQFVGSERPGRDLRLATRARFLCPGQFAEQVAIDHRRQRAVGDEAEIDVLRPTLARSIVDGRDFKRKGGDDCIAHKPLEGILAGRLGECRLLFIAREPVGQLRRGQPHCCARFKLDAVRYEVGDEIVGLCLLTGIVGMCDAQDCR